MFEGTFLLQIMIYAQDGMAVGIQTSHSEQTVYCRLVLITVGPYSVVKLRKCMFCITSVALNVYNS